MTLRAKRARASLSWPASKNCTKGRCLAAFSMNVQHMKAVQAYLFQDLQAHKPGVILADTGGWSKNRTLEGEHGCYDILYAHQNIKV